MINRQTTTVVTENEKHELEERCDAVNLAANQLGMALWLIRKCGSIEAARTAVDQAALAIAGMPTSRES